MNRNSVHKGDCLELMKDIETGSIDMILCDLPYGTTACKWDTVIPFEPLWEQYKRIIKPNGAVVLFGSEPFSSALRMSNIKNYKYDWVWVKTRCTGFVHSKNKPMKKHENIMIFSRGTTIHKGQSKKRMIYNPQGLKEVNKTVFRPNPKSTNTGFSYRKSHVREYVAKYENYPNDILEISNPNHKSLHPTQKPVPLFEYLIKTYTNQGDLVLDNCAGSGTTGVACQNLKRDFILMEQEQEYYDIIMTRLAENEKRIKEQLFI